MATVCDHCGKEFGHADLFRLGFVRNLGDNSVALVLVDYQEEVLSFCESDKVICAPCLIKLGLFESIAKERLKRRKRLPAAPETLPPPEE